MIKSVEELISRVKKDYSSWQTKTLPWFRGEPNNVSTPLRPKLYRHKADKTKYDENQLLQQFRMKAPSLGLMNTPPRGHTDQWLFLAQHVRLPTRLLDWTEGLFIALYFALLKNEPVVWMLDPVGLNRLSCNISIADNVFPLTWFSEYSSPVRKEDISDLAQFITLGENKIKARSPRHYLIRGFDENLGIINIRGAWEKDSVGTKYPVAIHPTYVHIRMNMQKSCFTIHGKDKSSLSSQVDSSILKKYIIDPNSVSKMRKDLRILGITNTSIFPDLDNLSKDLTELF